MIHLAAYPYNASQWHDVLLFFGLWPVWWWMRRRRAARVQRRRDAARRARIRARHSQSRYSDRR